MEKFDLTFPEKNIWLVENFYESKKINIISGSLVIKKDFDISLAEKTVNEYVRLNDAMRIKICIENNTPKQYVSEYVEFKADKVDVRDKTEEEIEKIKEEYISTPINVIDNLLFSYLLIDRGEGVGEIFLKAHHLICDGWSGSKMVMELADIYDKLLLNENIFEPYPSYLSYITKENEYKASEKYIKDEEFWKEYLKDFNTPALIKIEDVANTTAKRYSTKLNDNLNRLILDYSKENKVSPYSIFMTALAIYLERITAKQDIVIATPILNRSNFSEKQMQGMFVSTMPVRFNIDETKTFKDICLENAKGTMTLFRHQRFPFSKILDNVKKENSDIEKIHDVMVSYQNARAVFNKENTYSMTWNFSGNIQDSLEIHIIDLNNEGILEVDYDYLVDKFEDNEIVYFAKRIETIILEGLTKDKTVAEMEIMSKEEKNKILYDFNNTKRDYPNTKTVIDVFEEVVKTRKTDTAIIYNENKISYNEFNNMVGKVATYIKNKGISQNQMVAISQKRTPYMLATILGIMKAGAVYVPIDTELPKARKEYIINNCQASLVIIDDLEKDITGKNIETILKDTKCTEFTNETKLNNLAYVIYTSGTTGNPKGVKITHRSLINLLYAMDEIKKLSKCKVAISQAKYSFDMFVIETLLPLVMGIEIVLCDENESLMPDKIVHLIEENNVEILFITPTKLNLLFNVKENKNAFRKIKKLTVAGEVFPKNLLKKIKEVSDTDIFNGYGPTEATVCTTICKVQNDDITIGKCIGNTKTYIIDKKSRLLPINVSGELAIGGEGCFDGYVSNKEETERVTTYINGERLYKSGDKCRFRIDGNIDYLGRIDSQIKLNGQRIEIEEIEQSINKRNGVETSAVCVISNMLVAFVKGNVNLDNLKIEISKELPNYMVPKHFVLLDKLPLAATGKIDRKKLVNEFKIEDEESLEIAEYTDIQYTINNVINEICGTNKKYGIKEDLLKYGIDSLKLIEIVLKINSIYNIEISPKELFNSFNLTEVENIILNRIKVSNEEITNKVYDELIPISDIQKEIFISYKMDTESIIYNMPGELLFKNVDVDKLQKSIINVLNSNDIFKTNIVIDNTKVYLKVYDKKINVNVFKVSENDYKEIKSKFVKPFDLLNDTLVRCNIYVLNDKVYVLFDSHHIIMDGMSMSNLVHEIENEYNNISIEKKYSYLDYLKELNSDNKLEKEAENYFLNMLAGKEISTCIEPDYKRDNKRVFDGTKETLKLNSKVADKIKEISRVYGVTENSIFLTALKILLSKYTYSNDVVLGMAISGRRKLEQLHLVGMFVNTVPISEHISEKTKISEYLKTTQNEIFDSIEYGTYSNEKLINKLGIKKDISRNPIFDIVYTYQGFDTDSILFNNEKITILPLNSNVSKFDMTFEIVANKDEFELNIEYSKRLYCKDTIKKLMSSYFNCIKSLLENIDNCISDIDILSTKEHELIRNKFNNNTNIYNRDIISEFTNITNKYPTNIAVAHKNRQITYEELDNLSNKMARFLLDNKIEPNTVVGVMLEKSVDFIVTILAILKCGASYLPIDFELSEERIKYMMDNSKVSGVITRNKYLDKKNILKEIKDYNYIIVDNLNSIKEYSDISIDINIDASDMAYVMYTSGSTGNPKGVINTHKGVVRLVKNANYIEVLPEDKVSLSGTVVFDASIFETWVALLNGATLDITDKEELLDITKFENHIKTNKVNVMLLTSALFTKFAINKPEIFKDVKYLITGGDVFSTKGGNNVISTCPNTHVINAYGPTENSVIATTYEYTKQIEYNMPIGSPINGTECYILDKYFKEVPVGALGELYLSGEGLAKGYINNDELTQESFVNLPITNHKLYKTGDIVKCNSNYDIIFKGRKDNQIKIRGFRVEIEEITRAINSIYGIKTSYILVKEKNGNKNLYAYIVSDNKEEYNEKYIRNNLKTKIPYYMQPKYIVMLDSMPYTINGKVDKNVLSNIEINEENVIEKPRNDLENKLYNIWSEVLGREDFGISDNFFEIGGDSILATEFVIKCTNNGLNYSYSDIYNYSTIKELSENNSFNLDKIYNYNSYDLEELNKEITTENKIVCDNRKSILLTGATGFLGAHVLISLLEKIGDGKIYCLIREKLDISPINRLKNRIEFFFGERYNSLIEEKVIVVEGDIVKDGIFTNKEIEKEIISNVGKVVHTAAYVKHFDDKDMFEKLNVFGTKNVAKLCLKNNMRLFNVSTLSVSGNMLEGGQVEQSIDTITKYDEKCLYIGQKLYNGYVYSKFLAELEVLKLSKEGLAVTNIRTGNLTGRYTDGKFQPNVEENAFANRIKSFIALGVVPNSFEKMYLEFTPIDYASDAISKIVFDDETQPKVIHLYNYNHVDMANFINYLKNLEINISMIDDEKFSNILKDNIEKHNEDIGGIIIDIDNNSLSNINYMSNIIVNCEETIKYLKKLDFEWPKISEEYILKYIRYLKQIGFLK